MKLTIKVKDPNEAEAIKRVLAHPEIIAFLVAVDDLLRVDDDHARLLLDDLADALDDMKDAANVRGEKV